MNDVEHIEVIECFFEKQPLSRKHESYYRFKIKFA
jgi:hypothetical protein